MAESTITQGEVITAPARERESNNKTGSQLAHRVKPFELDPITVGKAFAESGMFPDIKSQAQAVVKIIAGQELGFGPMASMQGINMIEGKPSLAANLLAACVKRHPAYDYRVRKHEDAGCAIEFFQGGESLGVSTFTAEDAQRAGLTGKQNFKRYPKAMMFARALSQGVRWYCPDVTAGAPAYVPEELGAEVDESGEPIGTVPVPASEDTSGPWDEPQQPEEPPADPLPAERVNSIGKAIGTLGLTYGDIDLMLGACGADGLRAKSGKALRERLESLTSEQADAIEGELERRAVAGDGQ